MSIQLDMGAPEWAQRFKLAIEAAIEAAWTRPLPIFTVATIPSATNKKWLWRPVVVTDGAGNKWVAISNGTAWRYLEGTAV
jgi:hypothetical protein